MKQLLIVLVGLLSLDTIAQVEYEEYKEPASEDRAGIYVLQPKHFDSAVSYRLIIGLSGIGERGNGSITDLEKIRTTGTWSTLKKRVKADGRYILVLVQPLYEYEHGEVREAYEWAKTKFGSVIDWNRVYLTGLSLGGGGCQRFLAENRDADSIFAACAIVCPGDNQFFIKNADGYNNIEKYARTRPIWFLHAKNDPVVRPSQSTDITIGHIKAINPFVLVKRTLYKYEGHGAWVRAYGDIPAATPALADDYNDPLGGVMEFFEANELGQVADFPSRKSDSANSD